MCPVVVLSVALKRLFLMSILTAISKTIFKQQLLKNLLDVEHMIHSSLLKWSYIHGFLLRQVHFNISDT
jgi:hypothetical protein